MAANRQELTGMTTQSDKGYGSPTFICGFPKSGTTLLLALLDHHPELLVFPEETMFRKWASTPELWSLDYLLNETSIQAFQYDEVNWTSGYRSYKDVDFSRFKTLVESRWDTAKLSGKTILETLIFSYGDVTGQAGRKKWVEKTPGTEHLLGEIVQWWPDVRALCIVRDPRDNFAAYYNQKHEHYSPALFVKDWSSSVTVWTRFATSYPEHCLSIRYEDLVREPKTILEQICRFLDIQWNDSLLIPTRNGILWSGNSRDFIKFDRISDKPVGKFRRKLSADRIEFIEAWLKDAFDAFGYRDKDTPGRLWRTLPVLAKEKTRVIRRMLRSVRQMNTALRESKEAKRG
jgi:hypothetical protein